MAMGAGLEPVTSGLTGLIFKKKIAGCVFLAGSEGFEPPEGLPSPVFKTGAINRALPTAQISKAGSRLT